MLPYHDHQQKVIFTGLSIQHYMKNIQLNYTYIWPFLVWSEQCSSLTPGCVALDIQYVAVLIDIHDSSVSDIKKRKCDNKKPCFSI